MKIKQIQNLQIQKLISNKLICPKSPDIKKIYEQLEQYARDYDSSKINFASVNNLKEPFKEYLLSFQGNLDTIAIDLPIYLKSEIETDQTVMICAMDPLPPEPNKIKDEHGFNRAGFIRNNNIGFWVPFSLIDDWENPKGSMAQNGAFFKEILSNYNIYVTDIFKIFFRTQNQNNLTYKKSNKLKEFKNLSIGIKNVHGQILEKEIEIVKPKAIITLGNSSRDILLDTNYKVNNHSQRSTSWTTELQEYKWNNEIQIISSPHISGASNGAKMRIIKSKFHNHKGVFVNQLLAKLITEKLSAV